MGSPEQDAVRMAEAILGNRTPEDFSQHTVSEDRQPLVVVLSMETAGYLSAFMSLLIDKETDRKPGENINRILANKFSDPLIDSEGPLDNPIGRVFLDPREMGHINEEMVNHFSSKHIDPREKAKIIGSFWELNNAWIKSGGVPDEAFTSRFGLEL